MRNHTTPKIHDLSGPQGKEVTFSPTSSPGNVKYLLNALPVGKQGKFWYYTSAIWIRVTATLAVASTGGESDPDFVTHGMLWKIIQSIQVQCPILGTIFTAANTPGGVLGNLTQYIAMGYNSLPMSAPFASDAGATVTRTMYFRIPFTHEFLRKPHETAPWTGLLEGGNVQIQTAPNTILQDVSTGTLVSSLSLVSWVEMFPSPEPVIHTPFNWRLHTTPGGTTRHTITDMASPDGLQGIDQSKGAGLACLFDLSDTQGYGLGGSGNNDNIVGIDAPFRDQDRTDYPDATIAALMVQMGNNRKPGASPSAAILPVDGWGFPQADSELVESDGSLMSAYSLAYPVVAPGRDQETSKLQTVAGAKEMNLQYTSIPQGQSVWLGCYFPQFDEQFAATLAARIAPNSSGELAAKTLNKQAGGIRGVGKLAYVRQKIKS